MHACLIVLDVGELLLDAHVGIAAELDVGAAAGHVGRDGDRAGHAGLRDDVRLLLVVARVEHREHLGLFCTLIAGVERRECVRINVGRKHNGLAWTEDRTSGKDVGNTRE